MTSQTTRALEEITVRTDTRDILAHASREATRLGFDNMLIVDVDAHITETAFWGEIVERIAEGQGRPGDMELMERVGTNMRLGSLCGHGQLGYNPLASAVRFFGGEFRAQLAGEGPLPIGAFAGPRSTRRGAQILGETPTASVKDDFVMQIAPKTNGAAKEQPRNGR